MFHRVCDCIKIQRAEFFSLNILNSAMCMMWTEKKKAVIGQKYFLLLEILIYLLLIIITILTKIALSVNKNLYMPISAKRILWVDSKENC